MKFRTEIPSPSYPFQISYSDRMMFFGSCFSEHISQFFRTCRFQVGPDAFGILFNPLSIAQSLHFLAEKSFFCDEKMQNREEKMQDFDEKKQFFDGFCQFYDEKWHSFLHHGRFSHPQPELFWENIKSEFSAAADFLPQTDVLFVTLGTAYYYFHKERRRVVTNCHKVPAPAFEKQRAEVDQIVDAFSPFFRWRKQHAPHLRVVFTVSPVRHLSDGFHENQLSKSILHLSIEKLQHLYAEVYYFPAYEILLDDLRDYRFYDTDQCHPSAQAIAYLQEILTESLLDPFTRQQLDEVQRENRRTAHRPLNTAGEK